MWAAMSQGALSACSQTLVHAQQETDFLRDVCRILVEVGGFRLAWVGFAEQDERQTIRLVAQAGRAEGALGPPEITVAEAERCSAPFRVAVQTSKPAMARAILTNPEYAFCRAEAIRRGFGSLIALPLMADDRQEPT